MNMGQLVSTKPERDTPFNYELKGIQSALVRLEDLGETLANKLDPVLGPASPKAVEKSEKPALSPYVGELYQIKERIMTFNDKLDDFCHRLEI